MNPKWAITVSIVMLVAVLAIGAFTVFIQLNMTKTVSELKQNLTDFSKNVSTTFKIYHNPSGLYSFGGRRQEQRELLSSVSRFNTFTGKWEKMKNMSIAKYDSCGVVIGTKIYLFGGHIQSEQIAHAEVYDSLTNTYERLRNLPQVREECGAAVLNGSIYVVGGFVYGAQTMSSPLKYDIETDQWTSVSSMPKPRRVIQLLELQGRLYAIGGYHASTNTSTNTVEVYNATTDQWSAAANTQYNHSYFGAAVHDGKMYICSDAGFEVYSSDTNQWRNLTSLSNFEGGTLVSMNGKLWALGGGRPATKLVFTYDTLTGNWTRQADMDVERKQHLSFVVNHQN